MLNPRVGRHKRRRPAGEGEPSVSADGWLGITIERRLLEQRGQDRGCYEKDAVERLLGGVAHRLDPPSGARNAAPGREAGLSRFDEVL